MRNLACDEGMPKASNSKHMIWKMDVCTPFTIYVYKQYLTCKEHVKLEHHTRTRFRGIGSGYFCLTSRFSFVSRMTSSLTPASQDALKNNNTGITSTTPTFNRKVKFSSCSGKLAWKRRSNIIVCSCWQSNAISK